MGKGNCHELLKDRAKNRVDDLQGMFSDLQFARKESRTIDVAVLEEQVQQMLREWKAELNEPSPASSLNNGSHGSFTSEIYRLLKPYEEEDDAISPLKDTAAAKLEPGPEVLKGSDSVLYEQDYKIHHIPHDHIQFADECKGISSSIQSIEDNKLEGAAQFDFNQFDLSQDFGHDYISTFIDQDFSLEGTVPYDTSILANISPPPAAFLGPKCALWDCPRPAQGLDWSHDYCSSFHATLALNEGPPGMAPVLRPGGIGLKDALLLAALSAKAEGKDVGIPECEGAATAKSPWNAPELFDLSVLEGETIREWLFFDKPRRAFESGNRKQRSLPDYNGRGWHESRKQMMTEFGGLKRSYYMDPQPMNDCEWHLFEYEIDKYDACALYRLELKLVDWKKNSRGKLNGDSVADLQKQMGRLTAQFLSDNKRTVKGRTKVYLKSNDNVCPASAQLAPTNDTLDNRAGVEYDYLVKNLSDYNLT